MRMPRVELGSIAWKAIILTVGLQTLFYFEKTRPTFGKQIRVERNFFFHKKYAPLVLKLTMPKAIYKLYIIVSTP